MYGRLYGNPNQAPPCITPAMASGSHSDAFVHRAACVPSFQPQLVPLAFGHPSACRGPTLPQQARANCAPAYRCLCRPCDQRATAPSHRLRIPPAACPDCVSRSSGGLGGTTPACPVCGFTDVGKHHASVSASSAVSATALQRYKTGGNPCGV